MRAKRMIPLITFPLFLNLFFAVTTAVVAVATMVVAAVVAFVVTPLARATRTRFFLCTWCRAPDVVRLCMYRLDRRLRYRPASFPARRKMPHGGRENGNRAKIPGGTAGPPLALGMHVRALADRTMLPHRCSPPVIARAWSALCDTDDDDCDDDENERSEEKSMRT